MEISEFHLRIECFNSTQNDFEMTKDNVRMFKRQSLIEFIDCPLPSNGSLKMYLGITHITYVKKLVFKSSGANRDRMLNSEHIEGFEKLESLTVICEENCTFSDSLFRNMKNLNDLTLSGQEFPINIFKPLANIESINITTDGKTVNTHQHLVCVRCNEINQKLNLQKIPNFYIPKGRINILSFHNCEFVPRKSIKSVVMENFDVENVTEIVFQSIRKSFTAEEFQGFDKLVRLSISCDDECNYDENLFKYITNITDLTLLDATHVPADILQPLNKLKIFYLDNNNIQLDIQKNNIVITCSGISDLFLEIIPNFYVNTSATKLQINRCFLSSNITQSALATKFRIDNLQILEINPKIFDEHFTKTRFGADDDDVYKIEVESNIFDELIKSVKLFNSPNLEQFYIDDRILLKNIDAKFQGKTWKLLKLANNHIANFTNNYFYGFTNVLILQLTSNRIEFLETKVFDQLINLQSLDLTGNQLKNLPSQMFHFNNNLRYFGLVDNFVDVLETLPVDFLINLQGLEEVYISNESLRQLPENVFFGSTKIVKLTIIQTDLSRIPKFLLRDQILIQQFNLSDNMIVELDDNFFGSSKKLQVLQLSKNKLQNISKNIFNNLHELKSLFLNHNEISAVNESAFENLKSIESINLGNNMITSEGFNNFKLGSNENLHSLVLKKNLISNNYTINIPWSLTHLDLSYNFITKVRISRSINQSINIQAIDLKINNNNLTELPLKSDPAYDNVITINASSNQISELNLDNLPKDLQVLDLRNNNLRLISKDVLKQLNSLEAKLFLSRNLWLCDCSVVELLDFIRKNNEQIMDFEDILCGDGRKMITLETKDLCSILDIRVILLIVISICLTMLGFLVAIYYKFQKEIRIWLYSKNVCLWFVSEVELDKEKLYDAFIVFSSKDDDFVADLVLKLESDEHQYKCCVHLRDWEPGEMISTLIDNSINESRRTLVILSASFHESVWAKFELRMALLNAFGEKRNRVIVIILGDLCNFDNLDQDLQSYLKTNSYLRWGDCWFWEKLRYAMPHRETKSIKQTDIELKNY
ncbi:unnamed protein product [Diamesa serratosioi]